MNRLAAAFLSLTLMIGATGCRSGPAAPQRTVYTGPTLPLDQLIAGINRQTAPINTLRCAGDFELTLVENGKPRFLNGQLTLLHTRPDRLRILGDKDLAGRIFDLGTDGGQFWLTAFGDIDTSWHGTVRGAGESSDALPIAPELLIDVLGVGTLSADLLAQPVPTLRFNPDYDAYMLTWHRPITDRWATVREVWYDRQTLRPTRMWMFDRDGRVLLRAILSDFRRLRMSDSSAADMASRFDLAFPQTQARLMIRLDDLSDRKGRAPGERSYNYDPADAGVSNVENLDDASRR
jgi:hypothetical protein